MYTSFELKDVSIVKILASVAFALILKFVLIMTMHPIMLQHPQTHLSKRREDVLFKMHINRYIALQQN